MDLSRLMSRLAAIGGMQGAVTEAEEKCKDCGKVHEGECAIEEAKKPDDDGDGIPNWADKEEKEVKESSLDILRRQAGIQEAAPVNFDKVLDAIAALHGDDMWNNDAMQDLAHDLEQQNPTEQELDFIIAKGQLPQRLANTQFTRNDSVQFGEGASPVNFDKVLDAIAALYGDDMWNNDSMQDLAHDLEQQNPTDQELDSIIATGELPQRLANTQFTNNDSVKFGESEMSAMRKLAGIQEATVEEDDVEEGNEFAQKVQQLKSQGAKSGTKFKTSDGKEHILECGDDYEMGGQMSPMSVTGTEQPGMGVPAQVMSMGTDATGDASPKAKYTLSIQNGENNLQMTTDMPDEIIHIMKLAGVNKGAEVTKTEAPEQEQTKAPKQEVEEEWGNTPAQTKERDPKAYGDIRDWGMKGTGAGKPGSAMNKPSGSGDNPLGEQAMMEAYKKFKASK